VAHREILGGGQFLFADVLPEQIFTPEDFSVEQRLVGKSAEEFALGEVVPMMEELEPLNPDLLKQLMKKAGELGLLSLDIPEAYGGADMDMISSALVTERIHQGVSAFMLVYVMQTGVGSLPVLLFGTADQKNRYLPGLGTGELIGTYALTEPDHGSDALGAETTAELSDDGTYYLLNGQKQFSSNSGFTDVMSTYAKVDGARFTAFVVERTWEGVSLGEEEVKMGLHGSSTRSVFFENVKVPVGNVLGEIGRGHVVALTALSIGRFKLGAMSVGWAKALIKESIRHAKSRIQFGKPICNFGLIQYKIAEMVVRTYVAESMIYRTAHLLDQTLDELEQKSTAEHVMIGEALREYAIEGSINKIFGTEMLQYVSDESVQIMGGYGYIQGNLIERSYRDSRINRIWEGTNEINRLLITNTFLKNTLGGKVPLSAAAQAAAARLRKYQGRIVDEDVDLGEQRILVQRAKDITLLVADLTIGKLRNDLREEQEVSSLIADMVIQLYAMESALLRAIKHLSRNGKNKSRIRTAASEIYITDTFPKMVWMALQILNAICTGAEHKNITPLLENSVYLTKKNAIGLRRAIAKEAVKATQFPLSQL